MATRARVDMRRVLQVVERLEDVVEFTQFPGMALDAVAVAIPFDIGSYNEVDPLVPRLVEVSRPAFIHYPQQILRRWVELRDQQPLLAHYLRTGDGSARRISDQLSVDEFHATAIYREVYAPLGVEYQMSCTLPAAPPLVVAMALSRGTSDFSDQERALLDQLRPHLNRFYLLARRQSMLQAALQSAVTESEDQALALVDGSAVFPIGPRATAIVRRWFGSSPTDDSELAGWLREARTGTAHGSGIADDPPHRILARRDQGLQLEVRLVTGASGPDILLLTQTARSADVALVALGLRPREAEVLRRVADGASDRDVALALGISPATVRKHLERTYRQLGVSSRAAVVAAAHRALALVSN